MMFTRDQRRLHCGWGLPAIGLLVVCGGWYGWGSFSAGRMLGGSSAAGLTCGIVAGLIIAMEMLLWPRKHFRRLRLIPARHWMAAHLWFGFVSFPLALAHCGFEGGSTLTTWLLWLMGLACASGIYGLVVQNVLPRWMLRNLPAETIYSQIGHVSEISVEDARQMLVASCGRNPDGDHAATSAEPIEDASRQMQPVLMGAVQQSGSVQGRTLRVTNVRTNPQDASILWKAFAELRPYLLHGDSRPSALADPRDGDRWFLTLRRSCDPAASEIIDALYALFEQRQQFDVQRRVHVWLHAWIPIHVGLSIAVVVLLVLHIWLALKYW